MSEEQELIEKQIQISEENAKYYHKADDNMHEYWKKLAEDLRKELESREW